MRRMKKTLILAFLVSNAITFYGYGQWYHYADSETHSRGIAAFKNHVYLSSNTGLIYDHDIKRHTTMALNLNNPLKELRDIDVNGKKIVAMQSENSSKLVYVINNKSIAIPINREEIFFDGMVLYAQKGMMFGDPKNGNIPVFVSTSGGIQWTKAPTPLKALDGEYGFSASGNNIIYKDRSFYFVTGGKHSRFISTNDMGKSWFTSHLPFDDGESSGAYAIAMKNKKEGIVVGGSYEEPNSKQANCFITMDGGKTWKAPNTPPNGYMSCVIEYKGIYYCCGPNGIDYSTNDGQTWTKLANGKFYTLTAHKKRLYASADKGRLAKFKTPRK